MDLDISVVSKLRSPPQPEGRSQTPDSWEPGWAAVLTAERRLDTPLCSLQRVSLLPSHRHRVVKGNVWPHANVSCAKGPNGTVIYCFVFFLFGKMLNTPLFPCPHVLFKSCCINTQLLRIHLWSFKTQPSCEGKNTASLFVSFVRPYSAYV